MLKVFFGKYTHFLGPLSSLLVFYTVSLFAFFVFRLALLVKYFPRVLVVEDWWFFFIMGLRMDTILLSYIILPVCMMLIVLPSRIINKTSFYFASYFAVFMMVFLFLECATFPFMDEFDTRPDRLFIEQIIQIREIFGMIWIGYKWQLICAVLLMAIVGRLVFRFLRDLYLIAWQWSLRKRAALFIIIIPLLIAGGRSSLGHSPANIHDAAYSGSHLVNQLALSISLTLLTSRMVFLQLRPFSTSRS